MSYAWTNGSTNRPPHLFAVGDKVFDMPSQSIQTVTAVHIDVLIKGIWQSYFDTDNNNDPAYMVGYSVTGPLDPTGDGAFTDGSRCYFEVCDPDETIELNY